MYISKVENQTSNRLILNDYVIYKAVVFEHKFSCYCCMLRVSRVVAKLRSQAVEIIYWDTTLTPNIARSYTWVSTRRRGVDKEHLLRLTKEVWSLSLANSDSTFKSRGLLFFQ